MYVVGLTGGIGSGKSTVEAIFNRLGIDSVDADKASRAVVAPGSAALQKIAQHFGDHLITADGSLDRAALRALVFADAQQRQWLEKLLHPLIGQWLIQSLQAARSPYVLLVSPLLFEARQDQLANFCILVDLPEALQIERASKRDGASAEQIRQIMAAQMSRHERIAKADAVIDNTQPLNQVEAAVCALHQKILSAAHQASC